MTYEEAMDRCVIIRDTLLGRDLTITSNADNIEWATMCAEAIEMQMPKKLQEYELYTEDGELVHYEGCPNCKAILNKSHYFLKVCHCGQKLEV